MNCTERFCKFPILPFDRTINKIINYLQIVISKVTAESHQSSQVRRASRQPYGLFDISDKFCVATFNDNLVKNAVVL